jgi:hypothetical protein
MSTLGTKIIIDGDSTGFERAAGRVSKTMGGLTGKISGDLKSLAAGYVSFQAFKTLILDVGKAALAIDDFSDRQNTTIEETQRLIQAFKMFGLEAGDAETALMKMAVARKAASEQDDDKLAVFKKYGVSMDYLNNSSVTNFDLMKKIGVAMKDMKVDPAMMTDMQELFGKSGMKFIQGLKELGEGRAISMISSEDIAAADRMEKAFESMKNSWNAIASKPLAVIADALDALFSKRDTMSEQFTKLKQVKKYVEDNPEEKGAMMQASKNYLAAQTYGTQKEKVESGAKFRQRATMRLGKEEALKYFPLTDKEKSIEADIATQAEIKKKNNPPSSTKPFVDQRPIIIAKAQADLDETIKNALFAQLDPLDQNIAKRQEILDLIGKADKEQAKGTQEGDLESIRLQKQAVGIAAGLDSEKTPGIGAIPLDSAAKANLGVGVQAYDPMIYNTQQNTSALKDLTKRLQEIFPKKEISNIATVFE